MTKLREIYTFFTLPLILKKVSKSQRKNGKKFIGFKLVIYFPLSFPFPQNF